MKTRINQNEAANTAAKQMESSDLQLKESQAVAEWEDRFFRSQLNHSNKLQIIQDRRMQDEIEELQEKLAKFISGNYRDFLNDWQRMERSDRLLFYRTLIQKIFPEAFIAAQDEGDDNLPF
jgi:hypothetical protein